MYLSGLADEAGKDLETQIRAHQELGWTFIELRQIDGICVTDLDDTTFDGVADRLVEAGLQVSCFAAQLGNWSRPIDGDFGMDQAELRRAIPRMHRLGTRWIRCMSYPNSNPPLPDDQWRGKVIDRMRSLTAQAEQGDVVLVHENCHGWAGEGAEQAGQLLAAVDSPHLKLVFDTGNPLCKDQDAWQLYQALRDDIVYVHVKDAESDVNATFPGDGDCSVVQIVRDLLHRGYDGGFSIEPHITSVIHLNQHAADPARAYQTYIDYGRRLEQLLTTTQELQ